MDFREDQRLLFEGIIGRFTGFDGNVVITLELRDQAADEALSTTTLSLRGAPVIFPPDTQDATAFFVVDLPSGPENNRNFMDSLEVNMPEGISFNKLNGNSMGIAGFKIVCRPLITRFLVSMGPSTIYFICKPTGAAVFSSFSPMSGLLQTEAMWPHGEPSLA